MKSKVYSVQELVDHWQPRLLCLTETHMQVEEEITIPAYETIHRNNKALNSGGIIIAVKDKKKIITMPVKQGAEVGQTLWILLNNQKKKRKVGAIYEPQKGVTANKELKTLYTSIIEKNHKSKRRTLTINNNRRLLCKNRI